MAARRNPAARAERGTPTAIPEGKKTFVELLAAVGEVPGIKRVRFTTSHPRDFGEDIVQAIDAMPSTLCDHVHLPVQSSSARILNAMRRLYTREQYLERITWMKTAKREISITTDVIIGILPERRKQIRRNPEPARRSAIRRRVFVQVFAPQQEFRPIVEPGRCNSGGKRSRTGSSFSWPGSGISKSQGTRMCGTQCEVMVEGRNEARGQWIGRTSHNKTLNFTASDEAVLKARL